MLKFISRSVNKIASVLGYRISKASAGPDLSLYQGFSQQELAKKPFINIGAGRFSHPYWTNVDYGSDWYAKAQTQSFVEYDLTTL